MFQAAWQKTSQFACQCGEPQANLQAAIQQASQGAKGEPDAMLQKAGGEPIANCRRE